MPIAEGVDAVLREVRELLISKNEKYGNAALSPIRVFSKADSEQGLCVRIDDKLSRIANKGFSPDTDEDTLVDLIGYLVLLKISSNGELLKTQPESESEK